MWRLKWRDRLLATSSINFVVVFFILPVAAEIALTALPLWTSADHCAQSCVFFLSSSYSAYASCPTKDPAGCLCSAGRSVASVAHNCAATTCWTSSTYSEAPAYARLLISSYCLTNGYALSTMTAPAGVVATASNPNNATTSPAGPSTTSTNVFVSTNAQLSTPAPSLAPTSATTSNDPTAHPPNPAQHSAKPLSHGGIIGIALGSAAAFILILIAIILLCRWCTGVWISVGGCGLGSRQGGRRGSNRGSDEVELQASPQNSLESIYVYVDNGPFPGKALLDSGANGDYVERQWLETAGIESTQILKQVRGPRVITANKSPLNIEGSIILRWSGERDGKTSESCFNVVAELPFDFIIGIETLKKEKVFLRNPCATALRDTLPPCRIVDRQSSRLWDIVRQFFSS